MTERQLADLLRHIDDPAPIDAVESGFKMRLRADLDETLARDGTATARILAVDASPRPTPHALLAIAAVVLLVVAGALLLADRRADDAPAQPIVTSPPTTTVPVLDPSAACTRFRASNADELLEAVVPDDLTAAEVNDAVRAVDVLVADVDATRPDDPLRAVLVRVRDAMRESALRLGVDDRAGARAALDAARVDSRDRPGSTLFAACLDP